MPNQTMVYSCSGAEQEYTMVWFGIFLYFLIFSLKIRFCEQSVFVKSPLLEVTIIHCISVSPPINPKSTPNTRINLLSPQIHPNNKMYFSSPSISSMHLWKLYVLQLIKASKSKTLSLAHRIIIFFKGIHLSCKWNKV